MSITNSSKKIIVFIVFLLIPFIGKAEVGLSVSPQKFDLTVFPGESYNATLKLHNPSSIALPVNLKTIPFGAEEETGELLLDRFDSPRNPRTWISFESEELLLEPEEDKRLDFSVDIPVDAPAGGYYLFISLTPRVPDLDPDWGGARNVPTIGIPVMIATTELALDPNPEEELMEVIDFTARGERIFPFESLFVSADDGNRIETGLVRRKPTEYLFKVKNNDIYHFQPRGSLIIKNGFGETISETSFVGETVLPGMSRNFSITVEDEDLLSGRLLADLAVGRYDAELDLKGYGPVREEISLRINPTLSILTPHPFIFWPALVLILAVIFFLRKRIKKAFIVFINP